MLIKFKGSGVADVEGVCFQRTESVRLFHASDGEDGLGKEEEVVEVGDGDGDDEVISSNKDGGDVGKLGEGPEGG